MKLMNILQWSMLLVLGVTSIDGFSQEEPVKEEEKFEIADGQPVTIEDKGFTMTPPTGWEVSKTYPNTTLLLQAPKAATDKYRRTIQVMSFIDPVYVDDLFAEGFESTIIRKFSEASDSIRGYKIRNRSPVELKNGTLGYLFYAEFTVGTFGLMQMHVLVSSADRHFLMTFTDLAEYFDTQTAPEDHLNEAWQALGSVALESSGPTRLAGPITMLLAAAILTILASVLTFLRRRKAVKQYGDEMHELESGPAEGSSPVTKTPEDIDENGVSAGDEESVDSASKRDYVGDQDEDLEFSDDRPFKAG
jgi:hypothetical protein